MTMAVCTNCGQIKHGAWCTCPSCGLPGLDGEMSILLSDHNLTESELRQVGNAVHVIYETGLDEDMRFHLLVYFLSRKWSKLLEYHLDDVDPRLQKEIDSLYRSKLAGLSGQDGSGLRASPLVKHTWAKATGAVFQEEDEAWQREVRGLLLNGMLVAKHIVSLKIGFGEGSVLQRYAHYCRELFYSYDYGRLAAQATELVGDAAEYQRTVDYFCARVKNGWSDRTKEQAAYFRGLCQRLGEMANHTKTLIEHRAGIKRLIALDLNRTRQEFNQAYSIFMDISDAVHNPSLINPELV